MSRRGGIRSIAAATALALVPLAIPAPAPAASLLTVASIHIQAHRGGPALGAPENTIKLFQLAIASGVVDRIETDARPTSDNVPVIVHDSALPSTCSSPGLVVSQTAWADLQSVTCDGEPIPTLAEALATVKGTGVELAVELKHDSDWTSSFSTAYAQEVVSTILASDLPLSQVSTHSYYWRIYAGTVHEYGDGLRMTAMERTTRSDPTDPIYSNVRLAKSLGATGYAVTIADAQNDLLAFIRDYGHMSLGVQDKTTTAEVRFALANGVRLMGGDDPVQARADADALLEELQTNPLTRTRTRTDIPAVAVLKKKSMKKDARTYPKVIGTTGLVPAEAAQQLDGIRFTLTVTGKGRGKVEVAPAGSRVGVDGTRVRIPKGTRTFTVHASPGNWGEVRVRVTRAARVTLKVTGYRTANY